MSRPNEKAQSVTAVLTHHFSVIESPQRVGRYFDRSSEKVETALAFRQCLVEALGAADAFLVVQQQPGALRTAAEAQVGSGTGTARRLGAGGIFVAVGMTPLTQSLLVAVLARRTLRHAVRSVLGVDARVACCRTLQNLKQFLYTNSGIGR